jgi:hypothetical protein
VDGIGIDDDEIVVDSRPGLLTLFSWDVVQLDLEPLEFQCGPLKLLSRPDLRR